MKGRRAPLGEQGFTFLELAVVILLIGLIIGLATPRVQYALFTDDLRKTTRMFVGQVKQLRNEAIREQKDYLIHFDLESGRFWIDSPSMSEEERARAHEKAPQLPEGVRILDVWFRGKGKDVSGETWIRITKKGYVRESVIHLGSEDGRAFTLALSPFLGRIQVFERYIDYEG